jgi:hypothetical protein
MLEEGAIARYAVARGGEGARARDVDNKQLQGRDQYSRAVSVRTR